MREHKYKAYHKELDILTDIELINIIMRGVGVNYGCGQKAWRFNEIELMQYTGLKDKNGVEIYEGDILLGYCVYPECNIFESKLIGEVYYSSRGTWDCYSYILGGFNEQVEVIGNIYENADLLEPII